MKSVATTLLFHYPSEDCPSREEKGIQLFKTFAKVATVITVTTITMAILWGDWVMIVVGVVATVVLFRVAAALSRWE